MDKDKTLKLALDLEALILKTGMNPVIQNNCYLMHPEALQTVIDEAVKQARTQTKPVQDAEGENKAVRSFLTVYGPPGLTVGRMKLHMTMSGFTSWPAWVDTEPDGAHLTKAGAQLWIRHLFALETPPA